MNLRSSDEIQPALDALGRVGIDSADMLITLGSGHSSPWPAETEASLSYDQIPGWIAPSVPGHGGKLSLVRVGTEKILVMEGRHHYYEARSYSGILNPLRAARALGTRLALLTSSAGAIRPNLNPGDLVLISGHLLLHGFELPASIQDAWSDAGRAGYWEEGRRVMLEAARRTGVNLEEGTLICLTGPTYETRSEAEMARRWGADVAAMSLAPEALAAQALGMHVVGLSLVTNRVGAAAREPTEHREVLATARRFQPSIDRVLREAVPRLAAALDGVALSG